MVKLFKEKNRINTDCLKYDSASYTIGVNNDEVHSFWIADSDYETCPRVKRDIIKRAKH